MLPRPQDRSVAIARGVVGLGIAWLAFNALRGQQRAAGVVLAGAALWVGLADVRAAFDRLAPGVSGV